MITPIHTAAVGITNVRFYPAPEGRGTLPWVSIDDIFAALALSRKIRLGFKRDLRTNPEWKFAMMTVSEADGPVDISPNWAAHAFIGAAHEYYSSPIQTQIVYANGLMAAFDKLHPSAGMKGFQEALIFQIKEQKIFTQ